MQPSARRYFIPVCLYPHTKYRTRQGLEDLFHRFSLSRNPNLIVVADRLLALDRLMTGRYWRADSVFEKARREAMPVTRLIRRVVKQEGAEATSEVRLWDEIASQAEFTTFAEMLLRQIELNDGMSNEVDRFVSARVERFGSAVAPEVPIEAEREYVLSEITMSVYCTEKLGFQTEIWERPDRERVNDPIGALYETYPDLLASVIGTSPCRTLLYLYDEAD